MASHSPRLNIYHPDRKSPAHTSGYHYCLFSIEESETTPIFFMDPLILIHTKIILVWGGQSFHMTDYLHWFSQLQPLLISDISHISPTIIETVGVFNSNVSLSVISIKYVFHIRTRTSLFWILSPSSDVSSTPALWHLHIASMCPLYLHPNHWWNVEWSKTTGGFLNH